MSAAMACWAGNDALVKLCAGTLAVGPILTLRGVFALMLVVGMLALARERPELQALLKWPVALRCGLEFGAAFSSAWALSRAPLATVTALTMLAPLLAAVGAVCLRWERAQRQRLLAVALGLGGAILVVQPWHSERPDLGGVAAALVCAVCLAARDLSTRAVAPLLSPRLLTAATTATVCVAGAVLWWAGAPVVPAAIVGALWMLAAAATCATAGSLLLVHALRRSEIGAVMPFRFSLMLWAALLGLLMWDERPSASGWLGLALIATAGIAALRPVRARSQGPKGADSAQ
jgi:drug/metabolite transporter (DMT)-like permease